MSTQIFPSKEELPKMSENQKSISIVVPTFREVDNLPFLIREIEKVVISSNYQVELIIVDDDSKDGTAEVIKDLNKPWVKLMIRKENPGLSESILDGFNQVSHNIITVMDADLSHPPTSIPLMINALEDGYDFAIGSRYVEGAITDENWGLLRWINSKIATLLAFPLTSIRDPMSGFFTFKKTLLERCKYLNPIGYKILLELIVKTHAEKLKEVPIHFSNRFKGKSKLSIKQQLFYIIHLRRLYSYKYAESTHLFQFLVVGFIGVFVNLLTLSGMLLLGVNVQISILVAILLSMGSNFLLNRRFTFSYARSESMFKQFIGYVSACSIGAVVNYFITLTLVDIYRVIPQFAALIGIMAGTGFNYIINRFTVFPKK
jgi:dolichol-phosphate mannosyltransferase